MSDAPDSDDNTVRVPPDDTAWREAQRSVAERNEAASKAGKAKREAHERELAAARRTLDERGQVYR
jgi:hypothetical protein